MRGDGTWPSRVRLCSQAFEQLVVRVVVYVLRIGLWSSKTPLINWVFRPSIKDVMANLEVNREEERLFAT